MGQGPVIYETRQALGPCDEVTMRWAGANGTILAQGAVIRHIPRATLAAFLFGITLDADLFGAAPAPEQFAGILSDDSVGTVNQGDRITVIRPHMGTVVWCRSTAGLDNGDGVFIQDSATDQGFGDGTGYASGDMGVCLLDADAADHPFGTNGARLSPIKFTYGVDINVT